MTARRSGTDPSPDPAPVIHFLAVNYFGSASLSTLVDSLQHQTDDRWRVTVVDNSVSPDETKALERIVGQDPRITLATTERNLGYFGGAEWAVDTVDARSRWVAICNVDLVFSDRSFVARLADRPELAVIAPNVRSSAGFRLNPYFRSAPSLTWLRRRILYTRWALVANVRTFLAQYYRQWKAKRSGAPGGDTGETTIFAPHGSIVILPRALVVQAGFPHHPLFLFGEEFTVARYAEANACPVLYVPDLQVLHDEHQSTGRWRSRELIRYSREAAAHAYAVVKSRPRA